MEILKLLKSESSVRTGSCRKIFDSKNICLKNNVSVSTPFFVALMKKKFHDFSPNCAFLAPRPLKIFLKFSERKKSKLFGKN